MSIRSKFFCSLFLASLIPLLVIGIVSYQKSKTALTRAKIEALEEVARTSVSRIEHFFDERRGDIRTAQDYYNVKSNLPLLIALTNNRRGSDYLQVKHILDDQLKTFQKVSVYDDVMLVNTEGKIVYVSNEAHAEDDLGYFLPDPGNKAFEKGRHTIYVSEPYISGRRGEQPNLLVTAPLFGFSGEWIGVIALELDMSPIYKLINDSEGLGQTGETLLAKKVGEEILFLSPLRYDRSAALKKTIKPQHGIQVPMAAVLNGDGLSGIGRDYAGNEVLAVGRFIPSLSWGLVSKIDSNEALRDVRGMKYFIGIIGGALAVVLGFFSSVFSQSIFKPVKQLELGMAAVSEGNLECEVRSDAHDEMGRLAHHFNGMVGEIKTRNKALNDLQYALDESSIVAITDQKGIIQSVNDKFCELAQFSRAELIGQDHRIINSGYHSKEFFKEMWKTIENGKVWKGHFRNKARDGTNYWVASTIVPFLDEEGKPYQYLAIRTDITQQKNAEDKIRLLAQYDELTHLPNRALFNERLGQTIKMRSWGRHPFAVMFLDLDRFKLVNDTLGHSTGDQLLKQVSERLTACLRPEDTIARMGGDEFTILLPAIAKEEDACLVGQKIIGALKKPFMVSKKELLATGSIGISLYPDHGEDADTLLKNADAAMYRAKEDGRGRFKLYMPSLKASKSEKLEIISALSYAIERGELRLHYQALVDLQNGKVAGVEALIRWEREEYGLVSPADFIPMAEETGLIIPIGTWVLKKAVSQLKSWQNAGYVGLTLSVNVAAAQFQESGFMESVRTILKETGVSPGTLKLELTESVLMKNQEEAISKMKELKALGVLLAIDDFGMGYSSLNYLKRFPVDTLKIDQSFVRNIQEDPDDAAIAGMIITLADQLKLNVVAEGIETKEQLIFLQELRCQMGQGYFFSRPVPVEEFTELLKSTSMGKTLYHRLSDQLERPLQSKSKAPDPVSPTNS